MVAVRLVPFERGPESKAQPQGKQINRKKERESEHQVSGAEVKATARVPAGRWTAHCKGSKTLAHGLVIHVEYYWADRPSRRKPVAKDFTQDTKTWTGGHLLFLGPICLLISAINICFPLVQVVAKLSL